MGSMLWYIAKIILALDLVCQEFLTVGTCMFVIVILSSLTLHRYRNSKMGFGEKCQAWLIFFLAFNIFYLDTPDGDEYIHMSW